jgi:hypothetical protein
MAGCCKETHHSSSQVNKEEHGRVYIAMSAMAIYVMNLCTIAAVIEQTNYVVVEYAHSMHVGPAILGQPGFVILIYEISVTQLIILRITASLPVFDQ